MKEQFFKKGFLLLGILLLYSCATGPSKEEQSKMQTETAPPIPAEIKWTRAVARPANLPLPKLVTISKELPETDGKELKKLAYRAWDFDDDGRFEMMDEVDDRGSVIRTAFDFNGDGDPDFVQETVLLTPLPEQAPVAAQAVIPPASTEGPSEDLRLPKSQKVPSSSSQKAEPLSYGVSTESVRKAEKPYKFVNPERQGTYEDLRTRPLSP